MRMTAWVRSLVGCVAWRLNSRLQMGWMAAVFMACVGQPVCADDPVERLGEISGRVTLVGKVPRAKVADSTGQRKLLLQVSRRTRGVRYVVAFLEPHEKRPSGKTREAPLPVITIDQIDHEFVPHLSAIQSGQRIRFTNADAANHNVRSVAFESDNQFNVFTGGGQQYVHRFVAGKHGRPVGLECNLHPWMKAWIYVFDDTLFAVTDKQGNYRIAKIPFGEYDLQLVQPDVNLRRSQRIVIQSSKPVTADLQVSADDLRGKPR